MATDTWTDWDETATTRERIEILRIAGHFTAHQGAQPQPALTIADAILAWIDEAPTDADRVARLGAIRQVDNVGKPSNRDDMLDDPEAILAKAAAFYSFIAR